MARSMRVRRGTLTLRGLAAAPPPGNPYPNGVHVAGSGSSVPWATGFYVPLGLWVASTGFGLAPIYQPGDWPGLVGDNIIGALGNPTSSYAAPALGPTYNWLIPSMDPSTPSADNSLAIRLPGAGWQRIDYRFDGHYYVPAAVQGGSTADTGLTAFFSHAIEIGAIIGASIAAAGAAGFLGPTTPGIGAEAIGGSAAAAGSVAPAAVLAPAATAIAPEVTTAPEITGFTVPAIAPTAPIDAATLAPIDAATMTQTAVAAATSPLSGAFSVANYVKQLAGLYSTVTGLVKGVAPHPQGGAVTRLPDGSRSVVNPDGTTTVYPANGGPPITVGYDGQVGTGAYTTAPTSGIGAGGILLGLAALGMLLTR
jgi:hypothetical protein